MRIDARTVVLVMLVALAASAPSLANGFAYDDRWIIESNVRVHSLSRWADWTRTSYWPTVEASLFRPLTTAGFALQWAIGGGAPWIFHAVNVALYMAGAAAFMWLASRCVSPRAALVAGALFAAHPVHVEAVANAVGQSELSAGLAMFVATALYIRDRQAGTLRPRTRLAVGAIYLVAVLLKEHAMVLPAWLLAAEVTILRRERPVRALVRELAPMYAMLAGMAFFALVVRWDALGSLAGDIPHAVLLGLNAPQRALVMLGIVPELVRLLVWPAQLYADYSPQHVTVSSSLHLSQLNGAVVVCGVALLGAIAWRRSAAASFGLLALAVAWLPTANLIVPSGVLLAERTLYVASAGALIAVAAVFDALERRMAASGLPGIRVRTFAGAALGLVLVAAVGHSAARQRVWRSSEEVFTTMMRDQPNSFRAQYAWGGLLFERGDLAGGERAWRRAIELLPGYHRVYQDLADVYASKRLCMAAIPLYETALRLGGQLPRARGGLTACQLQMAQYSAARRTARLGVLDGNDPAWFRARLFSAESALVATDSLRR